MTVGIAGEHFIAYNLARRGINPALMNAGARAVDILATIDGSTVVSIQVKASWARQAPRQWIVGRHKPSPSPNFFYAFCNIWEDLRLDPEVFIVPSLFVFESVNWESSVPLFKITPDTEKRFKAAASEDDGWSLITQCLGI